jgi:hypothetical protein
LATSRERPAQRSLCGAQRVEALAGALRTPPDVGLPLMVFPRGSVATRARSENTDCRRVEIERLDARVLEARV